MVKLCSTYSFIKGARNPPTLDNVFTMQECNFIHPATNPRTANDIHALRVHATAACIPIHCSYSMVWLALAFM